MTLILIPLIKTINRRRLNIIFIARIDFLSVVFLELNVRGQCKFTFNPGNTANTF